FCPDPPTPLIATLSLHDALPISPCRWCWIRRTISAKPCAASMRACTAASGRDAIRWWWSDRVQSSPSYGGLLALRKITHIDCDRSEEHTSELQSRENLVCRLLLE